MEEVWKDISSLSSLPDTPLYHHSHSSPPHHHHRHHHHHLPHPPNSHSFRSMILQDFLKSHPTSSSYLSSSSSSSSSSSAATSPPSPPISTSTVLSLNSADNHHYFSIINSNYPPITNTNTITMDISTINNPCNSKGAAASSSSNNSNCTKKLNRFSDHCNTTTPDRRHKRMIKNRESAARSRARKQAYINELELEVAHLMEENATLRKQQHHRHRQEHHQPLFQVQPTITAAAAPAPAPTHHRRLIQNHAPRLPPILRRTTTAPF